MKEKTKPSIPVFLKIGFLSALLAFTATIVSMFLYQHEVYEEGKVTGTHIEYGWPIAAPWFFHLFVDSAPAEMKLASFFWVVVFFLVFYIPNLALWFVFILLSMSILFLIYKGVRKVLRK